MQKELRHWIFRSQTSLFSFTPPPHFNVAVATKSTGQSNILNIEKGEGGIGRIQCNFIAQIIANFLCNVSTFLHRIVDTLKIEYPSYLLKGSHDAELKVEFFKNWYSNLYFIE